MLQRMWVFVAGEQNIWILQQLAAHEKRYIVVLKCHQCECEWMLCSIILTITHLRIMFPKVWSSLLTVNMAALVTLESSSLTILVGGGQRKALSLIFNC